MRALVILGQCALMASGCGGRTPPEPSENVKDGAAGGLQPLGEVAMAGGGADVQEAGSEGRAAGLAGLDGRAGAGAPCEDDAGCEGRCLKGEGAASGLCATPCGGVCERAGDFCASLSGGSEGWCAPRCGDQGACPAGSRCAVAERAGSPEQREVVCLPARGEGATACQRQLDALGVAWMRWRVAPSHPEGSPGHLCEVRDPVWVGGTLHGVALSPGGGAPSPDLMSCEMALAVEKMSRVLSQKGVARVQHIGVYSCRTLRGSDRLSQHALGSAMDIVGFEMRRGPTISVQRHWEKDRVEPRTRQGQVLLEIARALHEEFVFNVVLTPDYNAAHADHLHVDLSPDRHFLSLGPDQALLGFPGGD